MFINIYYLYFRVFLISSFSADLSVIDTFRILLAYDVRDKMIMFAKAGKSPRNAEIVIPMLSDKKNTSKCEKLSSAVLSHISFTTIGALWTRARSRIYFFIPSRCFEGVSFDLNTLGGLFHPLLSIIYFGSPMGEPYPAKAYRNCFR